jgi:hypothetical protein
MADFLPQVSATYGLYLSVSHNQDLKVMNIRNEQADDGSDAEHVDQDAELVGILGFREVSLPEIHLLRGVDKHAVLSLDLELFR